MSGKVTSITEQPDLKSTEGLPTRISIAFLITQFRHLFSKAFKASVLWLPEASMILNSYWAYKGQKSNVECIFKGRITRRIHPFLNFNNSTRQNAKQNYNPSACLEVGIWMKNIIHSHWETAEQREACDNVTGIFVATKCKVILIILPILSLNKQIISQEVISKVLHFDVWICAKCINKSFSFVAIFFSPNFFSGNIILVKIYALWQRRLATTNT